jgi:hypothetical protein
VAVALAGLVFGAVACGPEYDRTEFTAIVPDDFGGSINVSSVRVHEGMILKSHTVAWNDDREPMSLVIRSENPEILEIANVITAHDYVFIGRKVGTTHVELVADGEVVLRIPAQVVAQPAMP